MKLYHIITAALTVTVFFLPFRSYQASAQEHVIDKVTVTEDGDSIITYKPDYYDFGPLNPGKPELLKRTAEQYPTAIGNDMDALRKAAFERDLNTLRMAATRMTRSSLSSSSDQTDKSSPVGKIPVQEGVTPTGARTYTVPIATSPSLKLVPRIALYYNSQSGQGLAGYGWTVSGLSSITITNKTRYYNGTPGPANYKDTDAVYALDGMTLVKNGKSVLADEYQLETARGHIVVKKHISNGKVTHFTVLYPDGSKAIFGQDGYTGDMKYSYPITELTDILGNRIVFKYMPYQSSTGYRHYISSIEYGFNDNGTPAGTIRFSYSADNLSHSIYYAGIETKFTYILKSISSYNGEDELCRYDLTHEQGRNDYILTAINYTSDGKNLNPLRFSYGTDTSMSGNREDFIRKGQLLLSSYFNTGDDVDIIYKSGKFMEGAGSNGMIAYPNFSTYDVTKTHIKKVLGIKVAEYHEYGSLFSADQQILIAPQFSGFSSTQSITAEEGFQGIEAVDVDADGTDEIVKINFNGIEGGYTILKITVYKFNASAVLQVKSSFNVKVSGIVTQGNYHSPVMRTYRFGDFKGDGKAQLATISLEKFLDINNVMPLTAVIDISAETMLSETVFFEDINADNEYLLFALDADNDGRTEICMATTSGIAMYNLSGSNFTATRTATGLNSSKFPKWDDETHDMFITDINGDGYPDFIYRTSSMYYAYRYTGDNKYISYPMAITIPEKDDELMFYDINHDGLPDLIQRSGTRLYFYPNYKGTISVANKVTSSISLSSDAKFLPCNIMDFNSLSNFAVIDGAYINTFDFSINIARDRLMSIFTDSHGKTTFNEYQDMSISDYVYSVDRSRTYGKEFGKKNSPMYLLYNTRTYASQDIYTGEILTSLYYRYFDAAYNWQGLGFCGFGRVETTDFMTTTNKEIVTSVTYDPTAFGVITGTEQAFRTSPESPFSTMTNSYSILSTKYGGINPRLSSSVEKNDLTGITVKTTYTYSDYDLPESINVKKSSDREISMTFFPDADLVEIDTNKFIRLADPIMHKEQNSPKTAISPGSPFRAISKSIKDYVQEKKQYTYTNRVSKSLYIIGQIASLKITSTRPETTQWVEQQTYEYDSNLMLPVKMTYYTGETGSNKVRETVWTYDDCGHVTSEKTAQYSSETLIGDTYTYDSEGRYLLSHTDAIGRTETYSDYNKFGKPGKITDYKGRVTSIEYDEWGNEISRTSPDGTVAKTVMSWGGKGLYTVTRTVTGQPDEITHYDAADRELRTGILRFDGSWLYADNIYDNKGRLEKTSMPFKGESASLWTTYEYDEYNRRIKSTEASGNTVSWGYDKWKITETRNGITATRTINPEGITVAIEDNSGTIEYSFRADGQPSSAGRPGAGLESLIRRHSTQENISPAGLPDDIGDFRPLGTSEMIILGYDDFGRRTSVSDPSAGRQTDTEVWTADGTSTVTHTNPNGTIITYRDCFGRTVKIERKGEYTTTYTYGPDGLLTGETSTNGTSKTYTYDSFDRLSSEMETVPDGKWLRKDYTYTAGSRISAIKYTSQSEEITTELYTYANGHCTSVSTSGGNTVWAITQENSLGLPTKAVTGTVKRTYSYTPYGQIAGRTMDGIQDFSYSFSPLTGNLSSRTDRTRNLSESFGYDTLNRLTDNNGQAVSYSTRGNITSMESVGSFTYGNIARPYQITSVSLTDGDAFQDREQTISYTCHSRPSRLNEGGRSAAFTYNGSNDRVKMYIADGATAVLTRYYLGGQYEIDITGEKRVERLYLNGDAYSSPMVLVKDGTAGWVPYNIGRDYLGSITHIATADGLLVAEYSYDAWGRLRDPQTHEIYLPGQEPELFLGRGFTGHEHLSWFGLINMNARLYDPVIGRFLSPDPYVQMPDFTQNFNRYSYCLNNPFVYIDEDGEFIITAIIIGAVIGAAIGVYQGYKIAESKGATGWDKAWYMIGGGLIGGAGGALGGWAGAAAGAAAAGAGIGGFLAGASTGGAAGAVTGFVNGFGMSMLNDPKNVGGAFIQGVYQAGLGGLSGAAIGGLIQGTASAIKGNNFWDGSTPSSVSVPDQTPHPVRDSYQKGIDGVNKAIDEYTAKGADLLSKEVSLDVNGTRVRLDAAFKLNGETILMEVKNGPHAGFTPNQAIAYPQMKLGVPVIPRGYNAGLVFGARQIGVPTNNYKFVIIRF